MHHQFFYHVHVQRHNCCLHQSLQLTQYIDDRMAQWYVGTIVQWHNGTKAQLYHGKGTMVQRNEGTMTRYAGLMIQWLYGIFCTMAQRYNGKMAQWLDGTMAR
jgi:hypothetical protein